MPMRKPKKKTPALKKKAPAPAARATSAPAAAKPGRKRGRRKGMLAGLGTHEHERDILDQYLHEVSKTPLLTQKEEIALARARAISSFCVSSGVLLTSWRYWSRMSRSCSCVPSPASMPLRRPRLRPGFAAAGADVALAAGAGAFFLSAGVFFLGLRMGTCFRSARYTTAGRKSSRIDMDSLDTAITPG